jgi:tRNA/rRNA methyltransferase
MLTAKQRDALEVVLVSTRNPLNIGAVARAMANFGLSRLTVVTPWGPSWREARSAVGAPQLLAEARESASVAEAVSACSLVIGTGCLTYRKPEQKVVALPELAQEIASTPVQKGRIALLFGPEKHGLTREDLSWCHLFTVIPTSPGQPSMNLGQAAAVCLYELAGRSSLPALPAAQEELPEPAPAGQLDRLAGLIEETMAAAGYSPRSMQAANHHDLRLMLRRLNPNAQDTRRMMGLFRRILWKTAAMKTSGQE